jgi:hypothetical protein
LLIAGKLISDVVPHEHVKLMESNVDIVSLSFMKLYLFIFSFFNERQSVVAFEGLLNKMFLQIILLSLFYRSQESIISAVTSV